MYDFITIMFSIKNDISEPDCRYNMRGGIPLYPRSARTRKKRKQTGLRVLKSGVALSVLFLYTSNQIGSTYGEFTTNAKQDTAIGLCSVFPGQIESLLREFGGHLKTITELKASLKGHTVTGSFSSSPALDGLSLEELDQIAAETADHITRATSEIGVLDSQLGFNAGVWLKIMQEAASAARILVQIGSYLVSYEPNCLEIRDAEFFEELKATLGQSGVLSASLADNLTSIMNVLISIHKIGNALPADSPVNALLEPKFSALQSQESAVSFIARAYTPQADVSEELRFAYEQLNAEMTGAKTSLTAEIDSLRNQQAQISEAKARLLEQVRKEEEERQAAEKKKQEEAEKAKEEAGKPDKDTPKKDTPPAQGGEPVDKNGGGGSDPSAPATPAPSATPEAQENEETKTAEGDNAPTSTPTEVPAAQAAPEASPAVTPTGESTAAAAPAPAPTASPAPVSTSDSDPSKGGE